MIGIEINADQLKRLAESVSAAKKNLTKEIAGAINATAKKTRLDMGRQIREAINLKKAASEKPISVRAQASATSLVAVVHLKKENRYGLQEFGAKQNKSGVSYTIGKSGGRKTVAGAFMGPKPGQLAPRLYGGVWKRMGDKRKMTKGLRKGKLAQPIVKLYGVSPWGAWTQNHMEVVQVEAVSKELFKQIERRINLNVLRASGLVKT
jgi:hypothetical protein